MSNKTKNIGVPIAWIAIFGAIIGATSFVPITPYIGTGGVLPLSVAVAAIAPLILGFGSGIISATIGGIIGMFVNPAGYPFGFVDIFFVAMLPAIFCGFAFSGKNIKFRIAYVAILIVSGIFAEVVPYYFPGPSGGFTLEPLQPFYALLVAVFLVPWIVLYLLPTGTKYLHIWIKSPRAKVRFLAALVGTLIGLMPWTLLMIAPGALVVGLSPELATAIWAFAILSRIIISIVASIILVALVEALRRTGLPAPKGAIWQPQ
jgi:hypothetical protein